VAVDARWALVSRRRQLLTDRFLCPGGNRAAFSGLTSRCSPEHESTRRSANSNDGLEGHRTLKSRPTPGSGLQRITLTCGRDGREIAYETSIRTSQNGYNKK